MPSHYTILYISPLPISAPCLILGVMRNANITKQPHGLEFACTCGLGAGMVLFFGTTLPSREKNPNRSCWHEEILARGAYSFKFMNTL